MGSEIRIFAKIWKIYCANENAGKSHIKGMEKRRWQSKFRKTNKNPYCTIRRIPIQISHRDTKHEKTSAIMSYSRACEILGFTTPKSLCENADLARSALNHFTIEAPLRYLVACDVLIKAAQECN